MDVVDLLPAPAVVPEEVDANVRYYTEGRRGPRVRPVRQVVLSGVSAPQLCAALSSRVDAWRSLGVEELVVHASAPSVRSGALGELPERAEHVVLTVSEVVMHSWPRSTPWHWAASGSRWH